MSPRCIPFQAVEDLIRDELVQRYKPFKTHEPEAMEAIEAYLQRKGIQISPEFIQDCKISALKANCRPSLMFAGLRMMALQLMDLYSKVTCDLGTLLYHYLPRTSTNLWGRTRDGLH